MDKEIISIEKLHDKTQWMTWRFQVRVTLVASDIFDIVNGSKVKPSPGTTDAEQKLLADWKLKDARAQKIIVTTIGQKFLLHILNCTTSHEMWQKLHSVLEQNNQTSIHLLQQKFFSFAKDPNDDIATHIAKIETIVQQLKDLGETITDSMVLTRVIMTLPVEYKHFISAWESTEKSSQTIELLTNRLMIEESRVTNGIDGTVKSEALLAKQNGGKLRAKVNAKPTKKKGKCFSCGIEGHWKGQCKADKLRTDNFSRSITSSSDGNKGFFCEIEQIAETMDNDHIWYADSGASSHMSNRREWFADFCEIQPQEITIGSGDKVYAIGRGNIDILSFDGRKWIEKRLLNALFVPKLCTNLFSTTKAMDNGHTLRSNNSKLELLDGNRVVAVGARRGTMFHMLLKVIERSGEMANVAESSLTLKTWHKRLGHQNAAHVRTFLKGRGIKFIDENFDCSGCSYGKNHRLSFDVRIEKSSKCGEIIHTDVCGPIEETSLNGSRYFVIFKDDFSHFRFVYFLKHKSEVLEKCKSFVRLAEKECGHPIRILQSDNGTEYVNNGMKQFLDENGIRHRRSVPYTPEQNGSAEREMRTIMEAARTMIHDKDMSPKLWAEAANCAVFVLNRTGTSTVKDKTPFELWYGKKADIQHFRTFGTQVFVHIPKEQRRKLDAKSKQCTFVGYDDNVKGYRVLNANNRVEIARDVRFVSDEYSGVNVSIEMSQNAPGECGEKVAGCGEKVAGCGEKVAECGQKVAECGENTAEKGEKAAECGEKVAECGGIVADRGGNVAECDDRPDDQRPSKVTRRRNTALCDLNETNVMQSRLRTRRSSVSMVAMLAVENEPKTYEEAVNSSERANWLAAMQDEYDSLIENGTWILVNRPKNQKVIDNKWVYKLKMNTDGSIERFKARLVVRGFTQVYGVDYEETFSPVVRFVSVRAILALAAERKAKLRQFDVKTAFLHGELKENVYMCQPTGFGDGSQRVCKLQKSLYGLKQASRCWNRKFSGFIEKFGLVASKSDPCVFINNSIILAIFVDDGIIAGNDDESIDCIIEYLQENFEVKVIEVGCFLGLEIDQLGDGSIFVHQTAYANRILRKFEMEDCNPVSVPSDPNQTLSNEDGSEKSVYPYRQLIGSLMYLAIATRPDICYAVNNASRYLERPSRMHEGAAKRIMKYVKGTSSFGLLYRSNGRQQIKCYSDADYAGDIDTRRSTTGFCFTIGSGVVSWNSERQKSVSLSTTESEYVAASNAVKELVWFKRMLNELSTDGSMESILYVDNQSAIRLIRNPEFHKRSKHIDVRYHFIREKFQEEEFQLEYVPTKDQIADIFTKALPKERFQTLRSLLGVVQIDK